MTLDFEYRRDTERGMNPSVPVNYYRDDSPEVGLWCAGGRTHAFCSPTGSGASWLPAGLGAEPAAMASSSRHTRSSGVGASMTSGCRDTGCVSSTRRASSEMLPSGLLRLSPYFRSPLTGHPIDDSITRIWCLRPVSRLISSRLAWSPCAICRGRTAPNAWLPPWERTTDTTCCCVPHS